MLQWQENDSDVDKAKPARIPQDIDDGKASTSESK